MQFYEIFWYGWIKNAFKIGTKIYNKIACNSWYNEKYKSTEKKLLNVNWNEEIHKMSECQKTYA